MLGKHVLKDAHLIDMGREGGLGFVELKLELGEKRCRCGWFGDLGLQLEVEREAELIGKVVDLAARTLGGYRAYNSCLQSHYASQRLSRETFAACLVTD